MRGWVSLSFTTPPREDKQQRASEILIHVKDTRIRALTPIPASTLSLSGILAKHLSGASAPFASKSCQTSAWWERLNFPLSVSACRKCTLSVWWVILSEKSPKKKKKVFSLTLLRLCICARVHLRWKCTVTTPLSCTSSRSLSRLVRLTTWLYGPWLRLWPLWPHCADREARQTLGGQAAWKRPWIITPAVKLLGKEMQKGLFSEARHPWVNADIRYSSLTNVILTYLLKVHVTCTKCYGQTMWLQNCVVTHTGGLRIDYRSDIQPYNM